MTIKRLSVQLANQIAAGEVVERQASVVKELLENAVDAGGSKIVLELKGAGRQLIRVRDDGCGIPKEELALALAPHATSKIANLEDLEAITTLGFRGEALASIASVSKLTLTSKTQDAPNAFSVYVEGPEQVSKIIPAAHLKGTTVDVCELFFNTPARRRFLKSDRTEMMRIRDVFIRCALSHPHLGFELISEGKSLIKVSAASDDATQMRRLSKLLGPDFERDGIALLGENPALEIKGTLLKAPEPYEQALELIYIFLNGRAIADRMLMHALREGYFESYQRNVPVRAVIYLSCDPHEVDVNVHPRKDEVRFHNTVQVHDILVQAVINALNRYTQGEVSFPKEESENASENLPKVLPAFPTGVRAKVDMQSVATTALKAKSQEPNVAVSTSAERSRSENLVFQNAKILQPQIQAQRFERVEPQNLRAHNLNEIEINTHEGKSGIIVLDEIVCGVSLVRLDKRFFLVKTQGLLEKVRAQNYVKAVATSTVKSAAMLMPFSVKLSPLQLKALKDAKEIAARCGFSIELSRSMVSLTTIPECIRGCDLASLAPQALSLIAAANTELQQGNCPQQLATLIAKASAPLVMSLDTIQNLIDSLESVEDLLSLADACQELPVQSMAREFLGRA